MSSVNKVILVGNLGKDPDIRTTQSGGEIANFSVATSEKWKDKSSGKYVEKTHWHNVVVFNPNLVRFLKEYATKGAKVYVEGALETREWQNKDGIDQYTTEVVIKQYAGDVVLLDSRNSGEERLQNSKPAHDDLDSGIPF